MGIQLTAPIRRAILAALLVFFLFGCTTMTPTPPSRFTSENIALVHQGMTTSELEALFGPADNVRTMMCGKGDTQWACEIWSYARPGESNPYIKNTFYFSVSAGRLLDQWDVSRAR